MQGPPGSTRRRQRRPGLDGYSAVYESTLVQDRLAKLFYTTCPVHFSAAGPQQLRASRQRGVRALKERGQDRCALVVAVDSFPANTRATEREKRSPAATGTQYVQSFSMMTFVMYVMGPGLCVRGQ